MLHQIWITKKLEFCDENVKRTISSIDSYTNIKILQKKQVNKILYVQSKIFEDTKFIVV